MKGEIILGKTFSTAKNLSWQLLELVQVNSDPFSSKGQIPLQLFKFQGIEVEDDTTLWIVAGSEGSTKGDGFIVQLLQKALSKGTFVNSPDIFLTPVMNPQASDKAPKPSFFSNGQKTTPLKNTLKGFPVGGAEAARTIEVQTLLRWANFIKPKALITFSLGQPHIRYLNAPPELLQKVCEIAERQAFEFGTEPEIVNEDGTTIPRENIETGLGQWCVEQGIAWIDFSLNNVHKNFDDMAQLEWKTCVGPALKWLVEGHRLNPPKEEPALPKLEVIPSLELPPEFANL